MRKKIGSIVLAAVLAVGFVGASPSTASAVCPERISLFGDGAGAGGMFVFCYTDAGITSLHFDHGPVHCRGFFNFDNGTWDDCFTSANVAGLTGNHRICLYANTFYGGSNMKLGNGLYGFSLAQWPNHDWDTGGGANDQISSVRPCTA